MLQMNDVDKCVLLQPGTVCGGNEPLAGEGAAVWDIAGAAEHRHRVCTVTRPGQWQSSLVLQHNQRTPGRHHSHGYPSASCLLSTTQSHLYGNHRQDNHG